MNADTTNNAIKLIGVITICAGFLSLPFLVYFKIIDPAVLLTLVSGGIGSLITYIFQKQASDARVATEQAKGASLAAQMRAEVATLKAESK